MISLYTLFTSAFYGASVAYLLSRFLDSINYARKTKAKGCGKIKSYPHWDPIFGMDFVIDQALPFKHHRFLEWMEELWARMGTKTFVARFLGMRRVYTSEMENMKAMSTGQWEEFVVGPIRMSNGVMKGFIGPGVSTSDAEFWQYSRDIIKPYFERQGFTNTDRLKPATDALLSLIPADGTTFDIQVLLRRWFFDTSTQFVFGISSESLLHPERDGVVHAMVDTMRAIRVRLIMEKFMFLHRDPKWTAGVKAIHEFMDEHIHEAYRQLAEQKKRLGDDYESADDSGRTDLLWHMVHKLDDPVLLRDQLVGVWFPSNETTSILLANAIFYLSRSPKDWQRLQDEVQALGDQPLTFTVLRGMKFLNWVINEIHRIQPNGIQMIRQAACDTTLPRGGGPDGSQPIFCAKGDVVHANRYLLHRDPDFWGPDASEFRPDRWADVRPLWHFVPFGGGPRICPAHTLVATEAAYVLTRFCQTVKAIEPRDNRPYKGVMRAGIANHHGVQIAVTRW